MATLPTRVYRALNEAGARMYGAKNNYKDLRRQIAGLRSQLANTPGIELMSLAEKRGQVYPVMVTTGTSGFLGLGLSELCFLGVSASGNGCITGVVTTFDDFLIYFCNYNSNAIHYIFERAMDGDPVTFDEAEEMDMSGNTIYQTHITNTVHSGQIINASGHARVNASVNVGGIVPPQFQDEYEELVNYLQRTKASPAAKNSRISEFIQALTSAGFGAIVGEIAKYLFSLV